MTWKPWKGDFRRLKSKKFAEGARPWTRLEVCAFGTHLGKSVGIYPRSAPRTVRTIIIFTIINSHVELDHFVKGFNPGVIS